jgi:1,2-diacylglycerol 3-alpha-glucosyltransferase
MKIAVLFDNFGPYHHARLEAASRQCDLLGIQFAATSNEYAWRSEQSGKNFRSTTLYSEGPSNQCATSRLQQHLRAILNDFRPETVAVPGWSGRLAFAAMIWCIRNCIPVVLMSESTADDERRVRLKEWIKRRVVGMSSTALVGGHRNRDYLVQLGLTPERIFFGYDVVENAHFARHAKEVRESASTWRKRLALPNKYFLASARFVKKKNLPNLLRAFADYQAACRSGDGTAPRPAWELVIVGDGELRPQLEALRKQLGIENTTHLPGFKQYDELPPYYALAEAFIHPSRQEPWGLVVNEAMATQLPVLISNRCGCAPTLVCEGGNGYTFDPDDVASLTQTMLNMARLPHATRHQMGERSGQIIEAFGPKRFADGLCQAAAVPHSSRPRPRTPWSLVLLYSLLAKSI